MAFFFLFVCLRYISWLCFLDCLRYPPLCRETDPKFYPNHALSILIVCFLAPFRWAPAKLFHEQLSRLAESEENVRHLGRLQERIEEGMALQVRPSALSEDGLHACVCVLMVASTALTDRLRPVL